MVMTSSTHPVPRVSERIGSGRGGNMSLDGSRTTRSTTYPQRLSCSSVNIVIFRRALHAFPIAVISVPFENRTVSNIASKSKLCCAPQLLEPSRCSNQGGPYMDQDEWITIREASVRSVIKARIRRMCNDENCSRCCVLVKQSDGKIKGDPFVLPRLLNTESLPRREVESEKLFPKTKEKEVTEGSY
ncbi:hypothetical protein L218DRAFT_952877 [Marasmius fiardii PR-910]|nr:hypothetical protein L218DRAFT_952877 [Marasmius fiardii PR-910]